jgi:hypothetical protein
MSFLGSIGHLLGLGGGSSKPQVITPPGNQAALNLLQQNAAPLVSSLANTNANTLQSVLGYGENVALGFQDYMNNMHTASQQGLAGLIDNYQNAFGQNLGNWNYATVSNINQQSNNVDTRISDYYKYNQQHLTDVYDSTLNNYNQFLNGVWGLAKQNEQQGYNRLDSAYNQAKGDVSNIANNTQFRDQIKGDYNDLLNKSQDVYNSEFRKSSGNLAALGMANTPALQQTQSDLVNKLQYDVLGKETGALNSEDMLREKMSGDTLSALAQQYPQLMAKLASEYSGQQTNLMDTGMQTEANLYGQKAGALAASDTLYGQMGVNAATHQEDLLNQAYTNQMQAGTNFLDNFYRTGLSAQSSLLNDYFQGSAQFQANLPSLSLQYASALTQATPQQQEWNSYIQLANAMNGINSAVTNTQGGSSFGNALGTVGGLAVGNSLFGGGSGSAGSSLGISNLLSNVGGAVSSGASWLASLFG